MSARGYALTQGEEKRGRDVTTLGKVKKGERDSKPETLFHNPAGKRTPYCGAWPAAGSESYIGIGLILKSSRWLKDQDVNCTQRERLWSGGRSGKVEPFAQGHSRGRR